MDTDQRKDEKQEPRTPAAHFWAQRARPAGEDAVWFLRKKIFWRAEDGVDGLGPRGRVAVFGGGAAVAIVATALGILVATSGGSATATSAPEALVIQRAQAPAAIVAPAPTAKPKKKTVKPSGPTLHGAAPSFGTSKEATSGTGGVAAGKAAAQGATKSAATGDAPATSGEGPAARGAGATTPAPGSKPHGSSGEVTVDSGAQTGALASTAKIGATPKATASAEAQTESLQGKTAGVGIAEKGATGEAPLGPPAPKAAKRTARRFAEAFVVYEVGGVDSAVRSQFRHTSTKQLSRALLQRPPRQPAGVEVPQAKVVNVVAGPSREGVFPVSVSLLRVGVTSELRLELEQGVGKKWQVTNVLG